MERRFCCAKSVACGRVIEREWGNPQRFPPHTPPSLRYARVRTTKPVGDHKKKHHPLGGFSFWNAAGRVELAASTCAHQRTDCCRIRVGRPALRPPPFITGAFVCRAAGCGHPALCMSAGIRSQRGGAALGTDSRVASRREASALGVLLGMTGAWAYRHAATIRQDGVSFLTVPGETPASGRAAPPAPRRSAPAGRPGRR